jgi:hypothetical protein
MLITSYKPFFSFRNMDLPDHISPLPGQLQEEETETISFSLPPRMAGTEDVTMTFKKDTTFSEIKHYILQNSHISGPVRIIEHYMHLGAVEISDSETVKNWMHPVDPIGGSELDVVSDNEVILTFYGLRSTQFSIRAALDCPVGVAFDTGSKYYAFKASTMKLMMEMPANQPANQTPARWSIEMEDIPMTDTPRSRGWMSNSQQFLRWNSINYSAPNQLVVKSYKA